MVKIFKNITNKIKNNFNKSESIIECDKVNINYLLNNKIDSIKNTMLNIESLDEFFKYYKDKFFIEKIEIRNWIDKGKKISGVYEDAFKLESYISTIEKFYSFLKYYEDAQNNYIFVRFFFDRKSDILLIVSDYSSIFNNVSFAEFKVFGIYQNSCISLEETMFDKKRLYMHITYEYHGGYGNYILKVNQIRSGDDKRGVYHGRDGMKCLSKIANDINKELINKNDNEKCIRKIVGDIMPDKGTISRENLVRFYDEICGAEINRSIFEIDIKL